MDLTRLTAKWAACRSRSICGTQQEARVRSKATPLHSGLGSPTDARLLEIQ
jgi:hypothetical protein